MEIVGIVALIAIVEYMFFGMAVGRARGTHGVQAPATSGNEIFERYYRVQQNTLEQLVIFLPALFLFALHVHALLAAGLGVVFVIGRAVYYRGYLEAPEKRGTGMMISFGANAILVLRSLVGLALALVRG